MFGVDQQMSKKACASIRHERYLCIPVSFLHGVTDSIILFDRNEAKSMVINEILGPARARCCFIKVVHISEDQRRCLEKY